MMYSFVTVAHAEDAWLLALQARSLRSFLEPALVGEIIVVENFGAGPRPAWRDDLLEDYGPVLSRHVRFIDAAEFGPMPDAAGWWTQQALKVLVSLVVTCSRYVVLDAKNHLVGPLRRDFLEVPDGRIKTRRYGYAHHPLRAALVRTLEFCGVDPKQHLDLFTPTSTPFTIDRLDAQEAMEFVSRKTGQAFPHAMIDRQLTEFFLLAGRLVARGQLERRYDFSQIPCPVVWPEASEPLQVLGVIREADERGAPVLGVHRRAVQRMPEVSREILGQFWKRRGLVGSTQEGVELLRRSG